MELMLSKYHFNKEDHYALQLISLENINVFFLTRGS